jgi:hypothetical protein
MSENKPPRNHREEFNLLDERPTLGEITYVLNGSSGLWNKANARFNDRIDYSLWRLFFSDRTVTYSTNGAVFSCDEIIKQLKRGKLEVAWGLIALLPSLFNNQGHKKCLSLDEWSQIFKSCNFLFKRGIQPIRRGEQTCHLAELLLMGAIQNFHWETRCHEIDCVEAIDFFEALAIVFKKIDPSWKPGNCPSREEMNKIKSERKIFSYETAIATSRIPRIIGNGVHMARQAAKRPQEISKEIDDLLNLAASFGITGWRLSRYLLKGERNWLSEKDPNTLNLDLENIKRQVQWILSETTLAAWDAGLYSTFPVLAHFYLWNAENTEENEKFAGFFAKWIHQLGLEIPSPFKREKPNAPSRVGQARNDAPYWWRLASDQRRNPDWVLILGKYEEWKQFLPEEEPNPSPLFYNPFRLFKSLAFAIAQGKYSNPTVARGAFRLALKYGWTGLADKLLGCFSATKKELLDFCHHLKRIQQACPFGIDEAEHKAWREVLKKCWVSLRPADSLASDELLLVHEVLVGRTIELLRWKGEDGAPVLAKKFNDLASEEEIRATYGDNTKVILPGVGTVNANEAINFLKAASKSALGACACVSIVRLSEDKFSFLTVDESCKTTEKWIAATKSFPGLEDELQLLKKTRNYWLKIGGNQKSPPIDWGDQCRELCRFIATLVQRLNKNCRWLMFALEQDLAELPWQDLVRRFWGGKEQVFVSLIPNIGWACRSYDDLKSFPKNEDIKKDLSSDDEFKEFKEEIERDTFPKTPSINSTTIFLGHGKKENGFTTIKAGTGLLGQNEWLDVGAYNLVMIHSCSAGDVGGGFLGDLGGIPALALGTGCRLVCAPITEVPLRTAKILHKHHVHNGDSLEFGIRYLQALAEDPWVGVYTCYGFGNQPIRTSFDRVA